MPVKLDAEIGGMSGALPIIYTEIKTMVDHYHATQGRKDDTRSGWVSVNELMALISDNKANGIRIYYGRHKDNGQLYPGRHNVILVATFDSTNPQDPKTETSINLLNYSATVGSVNSVSYTGLGGDAIPLCPPACPTTGPDL